MKREVLASNQLMSQCTGGGREQYRTVGGNICWPSLDKVKSSSDFEV